MVEHPATIQDTRSHSDDAADASEVLSHPVHSLKPGNDNSSTTNAETSTANKDAVSAINAIYDGIKQIEEHKEEWPADKLKEEFELTCANFQSLIEGMLSMKYGDRAYSDEDVQQQFQYSMEDVYKLYLQF